MIEEKKLPHSATQILPLGEVALVANEAPDGGTAAAGAGRHHNPARHRVALLLHLLEHALGNIVVAPPVSGAFGVGKLVHVMPLALRGQRPGPCIHLAGRIHKVAAPGIQLDLSYFFVRGVEPSRQ